MSRFVEGAIVKAGLWPVLVLHRAGDVAGLRDSAASWSTGDLLVLGALADAVRAEEVGETVFIHAGHHETRHAPIAAATSTVAWVDPPPGTSELEMLRAVAVARIGAPRGARIGVDWSRCGIEIAQVALGFGASDLRGPIQRKSGLPIFEDEQRKVKGEGMVELRSIKRREIADLVTHARRQAVFVGDGPARAAPREVTRDV